MDTLLHILLWILVVMIFSAGVAGSIIPSLPGPPLVFAGGLLYGICTGFSEVGWLTLLVLGVLAALSQILDYLASAYGAKKFGGSKWGMWGSILGGLLGAVLFSIPGLIIGLLAGAFLLEWWKGKKEALASLKISGGSLLGFLGGTLMKLICSLMMVGIFLADVLR